MESSKEIQRIKEELEEELKKAIIIKYQLISDGGSCKACASLDGNIFDSLSEVPQLPLHPNCKCTVIVVDVKEEEKLDDLEKIKKLKNEWFISQSPGYDIADMFIEEYRILRETNAIGNDAHQHALANARATSKYGKRGEIIAGTISETREFLDIIKNYKKSMKQRLKDRDEDLISNKIGRELGLKYPNASRNFLSDKLKKEYGISNKYFRENLLDAINQSNKFKN